MHPPKKPRLSGLSYAAHSTAANWETLGNTGDILAPAACLESNDRFNFDHLFETICLKQRDLSGRVPRRPPLPGAPSPGPNLLGAHQLSWGSSAFDSMQDRLKMLRNTLSITVVVFGIAATVAWSAFLGFALLRAFEFLL